MWKDYESVLFRLGGLFRVDVFLILDADKGHEDQDVDDADHDLQDGDGETAIQDIK